MIKLFIEDGEYEKEKLARQKNPSQTAQVFNLSDSSEQTNNENLPAPLPQPKPMHFPVAADIIVKPIEVPSNVPSETPQPAANSENMQAGEGESKGNQGGNQGGQSGSIVVQSPFSSVGGGSNNNPPSQEPEQPEQPQEPESPPPPPPPPPPSAPQPHLIINEIQVRNNEFVELYNPTSSSFDLSEYYFSYYSSTRDWNDPYRNQEFPASASVPASGYYLIGLEGYPATSGNPKSDWQVYNSEQLNNSNGSIAIFPFDPTTKTASESQAGAVDVVAWGNVDFVKEGTEFQTALGIDKSMQRINYQDNNDNNTDFELKTIPSPTNSNNQQRINGTTIVDTTIISTDTIWTIAGSPYYVESNAGQWPIVESGATLTIEPGVIVMPQNANYTFLEIRGTLEAEGTASDKIVFTSKSDSDYGGSGPAAAGDFKNIIFTSASTNSVLDYVLFRYGGKNSEVIKVDGSSIEIKNSTIENSFKNGIYLNNSSSEIKNTEIKNNLGTGIIIEGTESAPEISDCQISDNTQYGIEIKNSASPIIKDNSFSGNQIAAVYLKSAYPDFSNNHAINNALNGIIVDSQTLIDQDTTWKADMVYILKSNLGQYVTINENKTLIIEPGAIIKPQSPYYTALLIKGTLEAEAASGSEIVFTSIKDDSFGGDTNNDSNTTVPATGDWKKIKFESTSTGSVLDYVFMYYGTGVPPMDIAASASVEIKDTVDFAP